MSSPKRHKFTGPSEVCSHCSTVPLLSTVRDPLQPYSIWSWYPKLRICHRRPGPPRHLSSWQGRESCRASSAFRAGCGKSTGRRQLRLQGPLSLHLPECHMHPLPGWGHILWTSCKAWQPRSSCPPRPPHREFPFLPLTKRTGGQGSHQLRVRHRNLEDSPWLLPPPSRLRRECVSGVVSDSGAALPESSRSIQSLCPGCAHHPPEEPVDIPSPRCPLCQVGP
ncbi:hypothetical protein VTI74DRAFT_9446 [Chaetomium olivicolor]